MSPGPSSSSPSFHILSLQRQRDKALPKNLVRCLAVARSVEALSHCFKTSFGKKNPMGWERAWVKAYRLFFESVSWTWSGEPSAWGYSVVKSS